jgi:hypothetical protein
MSNKCQNDIKNLKNSKQMAANAPKEQHHVKIVHAIIRLKDMQNKIQNDETNLKIQNTLQLIHLKPNSLSKLSIKRSNHQICQP